MDESKEKPVDKILQNHDEQNLESDLKNLTLKKSAPISTENKMENVMELHDVQNLESDMEESTLAMRTKKIIVYGLSQDGSKLSANIRSKDIQEYFEQFNNVEKAVLTYRNRGLCVTFDNEDVVDKICEIEFHEINGK